MTPQRRATDFTLTDPATWIAFITKYGVGSAIAVYLVYFLTHDLVSRLDAQAAQALAAQTAATKLMLEHEGVTDRLRVLSEANVQLLYAVCSNNAKSDSEREFCQAALRGLK